MKPSELQGVAGKATTRVTLTLYWSEHYHGKWQPARTSDVNKPVVLGEFSPLGDGAFDRASLTLRSSEGRSGELNVIVDYTGRTSWASYQYFKLYNTHSLPIGGTHREGDDVRVRTEREREFSESSDENDVIFTVTYFDPSGRGAQQSFDRKILDKGVFYDIVRPRHYVAGIFEAPFFYQDRRHVFFVKSEKKQDSSGPISRCWRLVASASRIR